MFKKIDHLKATLDAHRPLPEAVVKNLHEDLVLRWTYNSNAIEGNTLTFMETKVVLESITVGGKSLRASRLLMNLELMKAGFPPVVIPAEQRLRYYQTLDNAHVKGDYQPFIELVAEVVEHSFEPYFFALGMKS